MNTCKSLNTALPYLVWGIFNWPSHQASQPHGCLYTTLYFSKVQLSFAIVGAHTMSTTHFTALLFNAPKIPRLSNALKRGTPTHNAVTSLCGDFNTFHRALANEKGKGVVV
jgi:hypothetical protein